MSTKFNTAIKNARLLLRGQHSGILSTISVSVTGYPFGSVTPFMINQHGEAIIYASDIAQHARNIKADSRVSICVNDPVQSDSQASARVTLIGNASADGVNENDKARYFKLFPHAKEYEKAHDFRFYVIRIHRVRYIGGFGEIFWFENTHWYSSFLDMSDVEAGAIKHMHEDHSDALAEIGKYLVVLHI